MRPAMFIAVATLVVAGSAAAQEADGTPRDLCLEQLDQWMNLDVGDPGQEVIRKDLKAKLEACLADGRMTQEDLAKAYLNV